MARAPGPFWLAAFPLIVIASLAGWIVIATAQYRRWLRARLPAEPHELELRGAEFGGRAAAPLVLGVENPHSPLAYHAEIVEVLRGLEGDADTTLAQRMTRVAERLRDGCEP